MLSNLKFSPVHRLVKAALIIKIPKKSRKNFRNTISSSKVNEECDKYLKNLTETI